MQRSRFRGHADDGVAGRCPLEQVQLRLGFMRARHLPLVGNLGHGGRELRWFCGSNLHYTVQQYVLRCSACPSSAATLHVCAEQLCRALLRQLPRCETNTASELRNS